jgi:hypothetical protein
MHVVDEVFVPSGAICLEQHDVSLDHEKDLVFLTETGITVVPFGYIPKRDYPREFSKMVASHLQISPPKEKSLRRSIWS